MTALLLICALAVIVGLLGLYLDARHEALDDASEDGGNGAGGFTHGHEDSQ